MASSARGALTKHGFPRGYRFVPDCLEIVDLLADRLRGVPLPPPLAGIFHELRILDHHPRDLYEAYKEHEEAGCIYFFSRREFPAPGGRRAGAEPSGKKRRPVRAANGGGWKPSGGAKQLRRPRTKGGGVAGRMVTMVFYERRRDGALVKTNWGMHEFTVPVITPDKFSDMAVYRLYKVKNGNKDKQAAGEAHEQANDGPADHHVPAVAAEQNPSTWAAAAGTSTANEYAFAATSTSQDQKQLGSIGQIHQHYHNQYPLAAAGMPGPSSWAPPPAAAGMPEPSTWVPQDDVKPLPSAAAGLPGYVQFAVAPPEPVNAPPPLVTVNQPEQQQAPATAPTQGSAGHVHEATRSPALAPAAASPVAGQPAVSSTSHDQSAGCGETIMDQEPPSQPELALPHAQDEVDMAALWNEVDPNSFITFDNHSMFDDCDFVFTMDELAGTAMDSDNPSTGDGDNQLQF